MKKIYIPFISFLVCGCVSPQYEFKVNSAINAGNNKTIKIISPDKSVGVTRLKPFFEKQLKSYGFKIVSSDKKSNYGFVYGIQSKSWQTMETIPVMGETSVRSISTDVRGNLQGNASSYYSGNLYSPGYYDGIADTSYNGSYYGASNTNISYNYGIKGYHSYSQSLQYCIYFDDYGL